MFKSTASGDWWVWDSERGVAASPGTDASLRWNLTNFEGSAFALDFTSTGFTLENNTSSFNESGREFIYMAIAAP